MKLWIKIKGSYYLRDIKNVSNYNFVGKQGRYWIAHKKRKVKKRVLKKRIKISRKEKLFIERIKRKGAKVDVKREVEIERKMLKRVQLLPVFKRGQFVKEINPKHKIISNNKVYGSFHELDLDKRDVYLGLMKNLITTKNQRFKDKLFSLRRELLKDGIVIEVDVYGMFAQRNMRRVYFGTLAIVGLMVEEAGFIESDLIGWSGENRNIERVFDSIVRNLGGEKCYWLKNNLSSDTISVHITDVSLRLNYA